MGASSSRRGMKRRSLFSGSRKRNVPASNCAQSEPNALRRHAEHEHARVLQPFLDLRRDAVAGLELPFIEPHAQPVLPQPLRDGAHDRLVLRAVAQEDVVCEIVSHISPLAPRFSSYQGAERHGCQPNVGSSAIIGACTARVGQPAPTCRVRKSSLNSDNGPGESPHGQHSQDTL